MYSLSYNIGETFVEYETVDVVEYIIELNKLRHNNIKYDTQHGGFFESPKIIIGDITYQLFYRNSDNTIFCHLYLFNCDKCIKIDIEKLYTPFKMTTLIFYIRYDDNQYIFTNEQELVYVLQTIICKSVTEKVTGILF